MGEGLGGVLTFCLEQHIHDQQVGSFVLRGVLGCVDACEESHQLIEGFKLAMQKPAQRGVVFYQPDPHCLIDGRGLER